MNATVAFPELALERSPVVDRFLDCIALGALSEVAS
mgnify:CR=1 FL=1